MKIEGIIIKSIEYKTSSNILFIYTKSGKKSIIVKASKKYSSKYLSNISLINRILYTSSKAKLPMLLDIEVLNTYKNIKNNIISTFCVMHSFEMISLLIKENDFDIDNEKLYYFTAKILNVYEKDVYKPILLKFIFQIKFLYIYGVGPSFKKCSKCGSLFDLKFSIKDGVSYCAECYKDDLLSVDLSFKLRELYYADINTEMTFLNAYSKQDIYNIQQALLLFNTYYLQVDFKSDELLLPFL